jgi:hypothetical protein
MREIRDPAKKIGLRRAQNCTGLGGCRCFVFSELRHFQFAWVYRSGRDRRWRSRIDKRPLDSSAAAESLGMTILVGSSVYRAGGGSYRQLVLSAVEGRAGRVALRRCSGQARGWCPGTAYEPRAGIPVRSPNREVVIRELASNTGTSSPCDKDQRHTKRVCRRMPFICVLPVSGGIGAGNKNDIC